VFLEIDGGRFTGGANGDEAIDAALDLEFHLFAQTVFIETAFAEGRDHGGKCTGEH